MSKDSVAEPIYNSIGKTYDVTRKADPIITQTIIKHLCPKQNKKYLDLGCGSGNYTGALNSKGISIDGVDVSSEMLGKAKIKYPNIQWHKGDARQLPFQAESYDGAICILATHHIKNITAAFQEAFRVISHGKFVIFTAAPEQYHQYWLGEYFPKMIENECKVMTSLEKITYALSHAGFKNIDSEPFFVTNDLQDLFLYAGKYRPEIYLNPDIRAGISSFHVSSYEEEITLGLANLELDIRSGKIQKIIQESENRSGDYLFVFAEK